MKFAVRHVTDVRYTSIVQLARFNLRLRPAPWPGQELADYRLTVQPRPATLTSETGPYLVNNCRLTLAEPTRQLRIESAFTVRKLALRDPIIVPALSVSLLRKDALISRDLSEYGPSSYLFPSRMIPLDAEISRWADEYLQGECLITDAATALMGAIYRQFRFDTKATETDTPPIEAFHQRRGVCQDFAQIMIAGLRGNGIPAAYVSGYLRTLPPPGAAALIGVDATHAWVNVWCGHDLGWIGFDPTNNVIAQRDHIFTAMGRDYADVAPIDGVFLGNSGQTLRVSVDVTPIE